MREVKMFYKNVAIPEGVSKTVDRIYSALLKPAQIYFGEPLQKLPPDSEHAVVAHAHLDGDAPNEFHCDLLPTVPVMVSSNNANSGFLYVARDKSAFGLPEIMANAHRLPPVSRTFTLFDGVNHAHGVEGAGGDPRTLIAVTYAPISRRSLLSLDRHHPRAKRLLGKL